MARIHAAGHPEAHTVEVCCYPRCSQNTTQVIEVPLCDAHAAKVYRRVRDAMSTLSNAKPFPATGSGRANPLHSDVTPGEVYFLRRGELVKIGFSTNVRRRIAALGGGQLLATIPGTMRDEQAMHRRFARLREQGEWFRMGDDLNRYLLSIRQVA